jgi:hypothetical protein
MVQQIPTRTFRAREKDSLLPRVFALTTARPTSSGTNTVKQILESVTRYCAHALTTPDTEAGLIGEVVTAGRNG